MHPCMYVCMRCVYACMRTYATSCIQTIMHTCIHACIIFRCRIGACIPAYIHNNTCMQYTTNNAPHRNTSHYAIYITSIHACISHIHVLQTYMHALMKCVHTHVRAYIHALHASHTCIHACMHKHIAYTHTYMDA